MAVRTVGLVPVVAAIVGNALVTVIKAVAALASGSSVMFSEAVHSLADTLNQVFLLIGVKRSSKKSDEGFGYGYGNERFFWALLSAPVLRSTTAYLRSSTPGLLKFMRSSFWCSGRHSLLRL